MFSKRRAPPTIVLLENRNKEAIQSMRLKTCAKGSITWYDVTPEVYWFNKSDYKGNVSLGRLSIVRSQMEFHNRKHPHLSKLGHLNSGWIRKSHCTKVITCRRSYWATISKNVTYFSKKPLKSFLMIAGSPRWASYRLNKDLKEEKNRLRNQYWLWFNGSSHKRRIVIKVRPHDSNDFKPRFTAFMRTPSLSQLVRNRGCLLSRVQMNRWWWSRPHQGENFLFLKWFSRRVYS